MDPLTLLIVILIVLWATGTFVFPVGSFVHLLIVIVIVIILIRALRGQPLL